MMSDLIFHHYDFSPFAEKIRLVFGLKSLPWRSVVIPSVMPKPDLVALTGGYRHTPVLQIGADVFCDTRLIARELDRRYPHPPLFEPHLTGLALAVEAWAERDLFWPVVRYVSGTNAEKVAPELHADRAALRGKQVAMQASPAPVRPSSGAAFDPPLGRRIALRPEDYTTGEIVGELVFADRDEIAIHRTDPSVGDVVVHFPRVGYALRRL